MSQVAFLKTELHDPDLELSISIMVFYPTDTPPQNLRFGPFELTVAPNAPMAEGKQHLLVISHGSGGSQLTHRTLAMYLAKEGYVVAIPQHPHNHRMDNSWEYTLENLVARPRHIRLTISHVLDLPRFSELRKETVGMIGHSVGGYTGLAVAGGQVHTGHIVDMCQESNAGNQPYWCEAIRKNGVQAQSIDVEQDDRIAALILLSPDVSLFMETGALEKVKLPIYLCETDHGLETQEKVDFFQAQLPAGSLRDSWIVKGAGHYSFLSPFPEAIRGHVGPAAQDPPGFDREVFHQELYERITQFFSNAQRD